MESRQHKPKGRPRHIHFDDIAIEEKFAKGKEDDMQEVGNDKDTSNQGLRSRDHVLVIM